MALVMSVTANAQFEEGKGYLGASLSGLDISSQQKQFHLGLNAKAGYLFMDNLMALGELGWEHWQSDPDKFTIGASARYYIIQNGLYLGAGLKYKHAKDYNDVLPGIQLYFDISTKGSDYMCYGLRVGVGVYLFKDQYQIRR